MATHPRSPGCLPSEWAEWSPVRPEELERSGFPELQNDRFLRAARGQAVDKLPVWIMRQAGRYLPEYHTPGPEGAPRPTFFERCDDASLAAQTTLQPLARFPLDAAIIFSDILTVPKALGRGLEMQPARGPVFDHPLELTDELLQPDDPRVMEALGPIMRALTVTRHRLRGHVPLVGFSGGPITLLFYMVEGASSKVWSRARSWLYAHREHSHAVLRRLTDTIVIYMVEQVRAGAQALQLFESSAGCLGPDLAEEFLVPYMREIAARIRHTLREEGLDSVPLIAFARECPSALFGLEASDFDVVSLEWGAKPMEVPFKPHTMALQGNLDPAVLYAPHNEIPTYVSRMVSSFPVTQSHIVNLGHGIYKDMEPAAVAIFVDAVHAVKLDRPLVIGTRASALAMVQTDMVWNGLTSAAPNHVFRKMTLQTLGDAAPETPLAELEGRNVFSGALERALIETRSVDLVVHSLKDLGAAISPGTVLAAVLPRASAEDMFLGGPSLDRNGQPLKSLADLPPNCCVGTSSARRKEQLLAIRPDLKVINVRGNIQTRLRKLREGQHGMQGLVLARAALERLQRESLGSFVLPFVPAVAQAAIGVQCRDDDDEVVRLVALLNHEPTRLAVQVERGLAGALGMTCHSAAGIYCSPDGDGGSWKVEAHFLKDSKQLRRTFHLQALSASLLDSVVKDLSERLVADGVNELL